MKPKAPVHQRLQELVKTSQGQVISSPNKDLIMNHSKLCKLGDQCKSRTDAELKLLQEIVEKSHELCLSLDKGRVSSELMETKEIMQVRKLARYWTACDRMAYASKRYAALFRRLDLQTLVPYESILLPSKPPLPMVKCHVHAEVQLLCFYALDPSSDVVPPRVIGVSKSACYLCNLFFSKYDCFYISSSHGKLYPQWTVPDTFAGSSLQHQRQRVQRVLSQVNGEVSQALHHWRKRKTTQIVPDPNESYASMPRLEPWSALPSEASSRQSHLSSGTITARPSSLHLAPNNIPAPPSGTTSNTTGPPPEKTTTTPPQSPKNVNEPSAGNVGARGISQAPNGRSPGSDDNDDFLGLRPTTRVPPSEPATPIIRCRQEERNVETPRPNSTPRSPSPPYPQGPPHPIVDIWENPLQAPVTADRPAKIHMGNMFLFFSVEAGAEGTVEVSDLPGNEGYATVDTVDVQGMKVGEDRLLCRDGNERRVVVYLQNGKAGRLVQVSLHWR